jgi:hypothetical protein
MAALVLAVMVVAVLAAIQAMAGTLTQMVAVAVVLVAETIALLGAMPLVAE